MPIYEYECNACGHYLEKLQKLSDAPLVDCPQCGQSQLQKLISAAGFRLKGGGWYETDFKKGDKKNLSSGSDGKKPDAAKSTGSAASAPAKDKPAAKKS